MTLSEKVIALCTETRDLRGKVADAAKAADAAAARIAELEKSAAESTLDADAVKAVNATLPD